MVCAYCRSDFAPGPRRRGSPRRFCRPSCRAAAWQRQQRVAGLAVVEAALTQALAVVRALREGETCAVHVVRALDAGHAAADVEPDPGRPD